MTPWQYFTDMVLYAPTVGCMLMCATAALVGTFVVLRGKALLGETLSHAAYPGVIAALVIERLLFPQEEYELVSMLITLFGAALSCVLAMYAIELLEQRFRVSSDSALAIVLASFFGAGLCALSGLQNSMPAL